MAVAMFSTGFTPKPCPHCTPFLPCDKHAKPPTPTSDMAAADGLDLAYDEDWTVQQSSTTEGLDLAGPPNSTFYLTELPDLVRPAKRESIRDKKERSRGILEPSQLRHILGRKKSAEESVVYHQVPRAVVEVRPLDRELSAKIIKAVSFSSFIRTKERRIRMAHQVKENLRHYTQRERARSFYNGVLDELRSINRHGREAEERRELQRVIEEQERIVSSVSTALRSRQQVDKVVVLEDPILKNALKEAKRKIQKQKAPRAADEEFAASLMHIDGDATWDGLPRVDIVVPKRPPRGIPHFAADRPHAHRPPSPRSLAAAINRQFPSQRMQTIGQISDTFDDSHPVLVRSESSWGDLKGNFARAPDPAPPPAPPPRERTPPIVLSRPRVDNCAFENLPLPESLTRPDSASSGTLLNHEGNPVGDADRGLDSPRSEAVVSPFLTSSQPMRRLSTLLSESPCLSGNLTPSATMSLGRRKSFIHSLTPTHQQSSTPILTVGHEPIMIMTDWRPRGGQTQALDMQKAQGTSEPDVSAATVKGRRHSMAVSGRSAADLMGPLGMDPRLGASMPGLPRAPAVSLTVPATITRSLSQPFVPTTIAIEEPSPPSTNANTAAATPVLIVTADSATDLSGKTKRPSLILPAPPTVAVPLDASSSSIITPGMLQRRGSRVRFADEGTEDGSAPGTPVQARQEKSRVTPFRSDSMEVAGVVARLTAEFNSPLIRPSNPSPSTPGAAAGATEQEAPVELKSARERIPTPSTKTQRSERNLPLLQIGDGASKPTGVAPSAKAADGNAVYAPVPPPPRRRPGRTGITALVIGAPRKRVGAAAGSQSARGRPTEPLSARDNPRQAATAREFVGRDGMMGLKGAAPRGKGPSAVPARTKYDPIVTPRGSVIVPPAEVPRRALRPGALKEARAWKPPSRNGSSSRGGDPASRASSRDRSESWEQHDHLPLQPDEMPISVVLTPLSELADMPEQARRLTPPRRSARSSPKHRPPPKALADAVSAAHAPPSERRSPTFARPGAPHSSPPRASHPTKAPAPPSPSTLVLPSPPTVPIPSPFSVHPTPSPPTRRRSTPHQARRPSSDDPLSTELTNRFAPRQDSNFSSNDSNDDPSHVVATLARFAPLSEISESGVPRVSHVPGPLAAPVPRLALPGIMEQPHKERSPRKADIDFTPRTLMALPGIHKSSSGSVSAATMRRRDSDSTGEPASARTQRKHSPASARESHSAIPSARWAPLSTPASSLPASPSQRPPPTLVVSGSEEFVSDDGSDQLVFPVVRSRSVNEGHQGSGPLHPPSVMVGSVGRASLSALAPDIIGPKPPSELRRTSQTARSVRRRRVERRRAEALACGVEISPASSVSSLHSQASQPPSRPAAPSFNHTLQVPGTQRKAVTVEETANYLAF